MPRGSASSRNAMSPAAARSSTWWPHTTNHAWLAATEGVVVLRVVGAGLGRTGTASLKQALERLLGAPCYHMAEVFTHLDHVPVWHAAIRGENVDWNAL